MTHKLIGIWMYPVCDPTRYAINKKGISGIQESAHYSAHTALHAQNNWNQNLYPEFPPKPSNKYVTTEAADKLRRKE